MVLIPELAESNPVCASVTAVAVAVELLGHRSLCIVLIESDSAFTWYQSS